ncbi:permease [Virgibacillus oceani]
MANKDYMPVTYFILGVLNLILVGFMLFAAYMAKAAPPQQTYIIFALMVMTFSLSYLYPHLKQKDERAKLIRQKGMFYSYFALVFYYIILTLIIQFDILQLTAMDLLNILVVLTICTVFLSWVILAKRN